jgi:hypothetical protein
MSVQQALLRNTGTCTAIISEKAQVTERRGRNSDVQYRGGTIRSSQEVVVMTTEQRDCIIWLDSKDNCQKTGGNDERQQTL